MKKFMVFLIIFFLQTACNRESLDNELPKVSQNGANTFGVKINGEMHTPKSSNNDLNNILMINTMVLHYLLMNLKR